ncbi:MAG: sulfatase-like hydrolase/transferase [Candidatus Hydrogenedentes bacterium]|nr:sulfatase-like hydrolase/transferase [Candidatus Hydrogenedentota bacterium]
MSTISRRSFLGSSSFALSMALAGVRGHGAAARPPNVVFLLGDDLRPDGLASLGNPVVHTPNIDSVVERGYCFRRAYTMGSMVGAVCLPSRTMLLTGRSLFHAQNEASGVDPASYTFPKVMKNAGYATLHAGKFGNSPKNITAEFDETVDPGQAGDVAASVTDFIVRRASQAPLFIYMAGREPHDPQYAPDSYYAQYDPAKIPLPASFAPYHPFDNGEMTVRDEMTLPFPRTPETVRAKLARYYASITYWDSEFGRVLQALRDAGQYENTIFIIAGDNGLSLGEHGLLGKQNLYEFGGMHVPLVFAGPGIPHGETNALAYLMDIFPTVCDLAGVPNPSKVEGESLAGVIHGRKRDVRDWLYTAYRDGQRAITDGRWKLIRYPLIDKTQLFDLRNDPHEAYDLASLPKHAKRVRAMMEKLGELQRQNDDPVPLNVAAPRPADWSPDLLTPEQLQYQVEETKRSGG